MESEVVVRIRKILKQAKSKGMTDEEIEEFLKANGYYKPFDTTSANQRACNILNCLVFKVYPTVFAIALLAYPLLQMMNGSPCLLVELSPFGEAVTPVVNCKVCEGVTEAPRLKNLSMDDFIRNYAYTSKPLLVEGAVSNWSALNVVSYDFFKSLYTRLPESLSEDNDKGQFFSYGSNIGDLKDLFSLPSEVAATEGEKWYIGWSTSDPFIEKALSKHVSIPYFIPPSLSDIHMSWIFMGSPGPGANIHIDMVGLSSWQAQLRGKKTWSLIPPPECEHVCTSFNVTMNQGDVIIVDTNKWYHQTYIHPGNISITIGSEYN